MMVYALLLVFASLITALAFVLTSMYQLYRAEQMLLDTLSRDRDRLFSVTKSLAFLSPEGMEDGRSRQDLFRNTPELLSKINNAISEIDSLVRHVSSDWPPAYVIAILAPLEQASDNAKASYLVKLNHAIK